MRTLKIFAAIAILSACTWGACHANKVRQMHQQLDGPHCIPHINCSN